MPCEESIQEEFGFQPLCVSTACRSMNVKIHDQWIRTSKMDTNNNNNKNNKNNHNKFTAAVVTGCNAQKHQIANFS